MERRALLCEFPEVNSTSQQKHAWCQRIRAGAASRLRTV